MTEICLSYKKQRSVPLVPIAFLLALPMSAHAYVDPGSGSLLLQLFLGGMAGLVVVGKLYWHRMLVFLRIRKPGDEEEPEELDQQKRDAPEGSGAE